MIQGRNFIIFSDDWGRHPFSCQHIMEQFLPHNKLLWVNTIGMRTPTLSLYDMKRALGKIRSWLKPSTQKSHEVMHPHLRILSPFMIPYNIYAPVRAFNAKSVVKSVLKAAEEWGFSDPILLTTQPLAADYLGKLGESLTVYYCVDDFIFWPGMNQPQLVKSMEDSLVRSADLIFSVSEALCATRQNGRSPTKLLTHGVDVGHFSQQELTPPSTLTSLGGPIIGFYGLIDQRLDLDLLEHIVRKKPQWHMVCVGKSCIDLSTLHKYTNFHHIDAVPYADLPRYAACFDVACIPYKVNAQTHSINPLKLKEYMATYKPIVSTPLQEALPFAQTISIAEGHKAFLNALEAALSHTIDTNTRASCLQGQSWQDKAELVSLWIEEALAHKETKTRSAEGTYV